MKKIQTLLIVAAIIVGLGIVAVSPVSALECSVLPQSICNASEQGELQNSGIWRLLLLAINILTVGIGIAAVGAIVFAGFLYATATDDQSKTKKAIEMIRNTAIGLIVYALMFSAANFLIPGGIFTTSGGGGGSCVPGEPC